MSNQILVNQSNLSTDKCDQLYFRVIIYIQFKHLFNHIKPALCDAKIYLLHNINKNVNANPYQKILTPDIYQNYK